MTVFSTGPSACPSCGARLGWTTGASVQQQKAPQAGELLLCAECGAALRFVAGFGASLMVRELSDAEQEALPIGLRAEIAITRQRLRNFNASYPAARK